MRRRRRVRWPRCVLLVGATSSVGAATDVAQSWQEMSPQERGEAYRNYQRFQKLPPEQRRKVERNYDRWQQLPPQEKERLRSNYRQYREMKPGTSASDLQRRYDQLRSSER